MSINMPKSIKEERLRWVKPIANKEIKLVDAIKVCPHSKRSLERWLAVYLKHGENGLVSKSTRPKTNPKETPIHIKEKIIQTRKKTKKCALKIKWCLEKEGIYLHKNTIHKIIKAEGLTKKYKTRKLQYRYIKVPLKPGELVEIDIKFVPKKLENRRFYQFTAIDCASRWRYLEIFDEMSNFNSIQFLNHIIKKAPFKINAIKTDNASYFTNRSVGYLKSTDPSNPKIHAFDLECSKYNIIHYLIDPGKPAQNGKVERSHRSDQEIFYNRTQFKTIDELKFKLKKWNFTYNNTEHCALNGKTPNEMLKSLLNKQPTNVYV
jgi:hypothetical protein